MYCRGLGPTLRSTFPPTELPLARFAEFTLTSSAFIRHLPVGIYFRRAARLPRLSQGRKEHCVLVRVSRIVPCFIALATSETDDEYERMPLKFSSMRPGFFQGLFEEV